LPIDLKSTLSFTIPQVKTARPAGNLKKRTNQVVLESKLRMAIVVFAVASSGTAHVHAQSLVTPTNLKISPMTRRSEFYCNLKALDPNERECHKKLTEKLTAARTKVIETQRGYQFQFNPVAISLTELAEWVSNESKCCLFFDFQIDVKNEASMLSLRLTGDKGVKAFVRAEFKL
jgi:hypothetical protein